MPILKNRTDALLYILDYMVGIDQNLNENESALFIQTAFRLLPGEEIQEKIQWIAKLWREHDREQLLEEACARIKEHRTIKKDLTLIREMAAADGVIDPKEQELFEKVCKHLGVPSEQLTL